MNRQDVLHLFDNCIFSGELTTDSFGEDILEYLPEDFHYDYFYGMSRLTLVPVDEDFVIKVPFNGSIDEEYNSADCEWDNPVFYEFECANRDRNRKWDYCFAEVLNYRRAKAHHVAQFFAKPSFIGLAQGHPIYIQEKATPFGETTHDWETYRRTRAYGYIENHYDNYEANFGFCGFTGNCLMWLTDALRYYGQNGFNKMMNFVYNTGIYDLHDGNIGYIDSRPVIFDFASWED